MPPKQHEVSIILALKDQASRGIKQFEKDFGLSLKAAAGIAAAGMAALTAEIVLSTKAAIESERVEAQLANAVRRAGLDVQKTTAHLADHAKHLQLTTGADDEAIASAQQLLITLGRLSGDGLDRATEAALNLSVATGTDLGTAATMIAKLANGNTTAFQKLGVSFDGATTNAEKLERGLEFIEERMGGSAAAAGATFEGRLKALTGQFGNVQEEIGKVITQSAPLNAFLQEAARLVSLLGESIADNRTVLIEWLQTAVVGGVEGLGKLAEISLRAAAAAQQFTHVFNGLLRSVSVNEEATAAYTAAMVDAEESYNRLTAAAVAVSGWTEEFAQKIREMQPDLGSLADRLSPGPGSVSGGLDDVSDSAKKAKTDLKDFIDVGKDPWDFALNAGAVSTDNAENTPGPVNRGEGMARFSEETERYVAILANLNAGTLDYNDTLAEYDKLIELGHELGLTTQEIQAGITDGVTNETIARQALITKLQQHAQVAGQVGSVLTAANAAASAAGINSTRLQFALKTAEAIKNQFMEIAAATASLAADDTAGAVLHYIAAGLWGVAAGYSFKSTITGKAATGGLVAGSGSRDTAPFLLTPGEAVLTQTQTQAILGGRAAIVPAGAAGGGGGVTIINQFSGGARAEDVGDLIEAISHAVRRTGRVLVATRVLEPA